MSTPPQDPRSAGGPGYPDDGRQRQGQGWPQQPQGQGWPPVPPGQGWPQQAGQGPALPPPPGAVPAGAPPAPTGPAPRPGVARALIAVLVVVVVALGVFLYLQNKNTDTAQAEVGACIRVEGTTTLDRPKSEQVPCSDPAAAFVVTASGDSSVTCDEYELTFEQYAGQDESDVDTRLCLRPNFTVGGCYLEGKTSVDLPAVGSCSTLQGTGKVQVLSIDTSTSSTARCPDPELAYSYPLRNVAVCFGRP